MDTTSNSDRHPLRTEPRPEFLGRVLTSELPLNNDERLYIFKTRWAERNFFNQKEVQR